jgi:hypothetical protein
MMKKFNYSSDKYKAVFFSTDGLIANLNIEKKIRSSKPENISNQPKPNLCNIVSIDPGVTDFLTMTEFNCDPSAFNAYPSNNDNRLSVLEKKPESIQVNSCKTVQIDKIKNYIGHRLSFWKS